MYFRKPCTEVLCKYTESFVVSCISFKLDLEYSYESISGSVLVGEEIIVEARVIEVEHQFVWISQGSGEREASGVSMETFHWGVRGRVLGNIIIIYNGGKYL